MAADSLNGWLILDKPIGLSSAQGVAAIKRILRGVGIRPDRIGHGGTLDPLATGVLPIAIGEATKLAGRMLDATKGYDFTVKWGEATTTEDAEGAVIAISDIRPDAEAITAMLPRFTGPIDQVPERFWLMGAFMIGLGGMSWERGSTGVAVGWLGGMARTEWRSLEVSRASGY